MAPPYFALLNTGALPPYFALLNTGALSPYFALLNTGSCARYVLAALRAYARAFFVLRRKENADWRIEAERSLLIDSHRAADE